MQYHTWIDQEWKIMNTLHTAGIALPKPLVVGKRAILMSFLGDSDGSTPMLHELRPDPRTTTRIIDFPQAVDPRLNHDGASLLARDIENVCKWANKHGVHRPENRIMSDLWSRFVMGELG